MRPVRLEFSGLQSYRESQTVDFEELGRLGLFGIFGPTGAGKSTILDAVTLALYGTVDRSQSGNQGIINQQEKKAEVRFTFRLGDTLYRSERQYVRTGDKGGANCRNARLLKVDEAGEALEVLADGSNDSKSALTELLDMTQKDFNRAVVLPQGKFDEFLKLEGRDRRAMLENIFGLELYGEALSARVREDVNRCRGLLENIAAEKRGLGECSKESLNSARREAATAASLLEDKLKELETLQTELLRQEHLRTVFTEATGNELRLRSLEQEMIEVAGAAEPAKKALEQAISDARETKIRCTEQSTTLSMHLQRLAEAEGLAEECRRVRNDIGLADNKLSDLHLRSAQAAAQLRSANEGRERLTGELRELALRYDTLRTDPALRAMLDKAAPLLTRLRTREHDLSSLNRELSEKHTALDRERLEILKAIAAWFKSEQPAADLSNLWEMLENLLQRGEAALAEARSDREQAEMKAGAAVLAASLVEGEPCPVCGSGDHPAPCDGDATQKTREARRRLEQIEKTLSELRLGAGTVQKRLAVYTTGRAALDELKERANAVRTEISGLGHDIAAVTGGLDPDEIEKRLKEQASTAAELEKIELQRRETERRAGETAVVVEKLQLETAGHTAAIGSVETELRLLHDRERALDGKVRAICGEDDPIKLRHGINCELEELQRASEIAVTREDDARKALEECRNRQSVLSGTMAELRRRLSAQQAELEQAGFDGGRYEIMKSHADDTAGAADILREQAAVAAAEFEAMQKSHLRWQELEAFKDRTEGRLVLGRRLESLLKGRRFIDYLAEHHLRDMVVEASSRLGSLTGQRYALELGPDCEFIVRDDYNGGQRRPVCSLSGGETFMTSLALALALSSQIQIKGRYPLGFFFLDEGFGTLDQEKLEAVVASLEKLHDSSRMVGIISHVPELHQRLPRYLEVTAPSSDGDGSTVRLYNN
ncbi:MAG: SMC family ATPase [bacterium]|nr:SMC family ATPase [bacterium]